MQITVDEVKSRLNLDRPDIAALGDDVSARATYPIADIRMAWELILKQDLRIKELRAYAECEDALTTHGIRKFADYVLPVFVTHGFRPDFIDQQTIEKFLDYLRKQALTNEGI
jgi:hypothetical protein